MVYSAQVAVSVIIPTWNRARELANAVSSILAQTYPVHEILVCDDGSDDDSKAVVAGFDDPRVKWVPGPRGGRPAIPRNRGMRIATGEWLAFLDSDDTWLPDKVQQQLSLASSLGVSAVASNAWRVVDGDASVQKYLRHASPVVALSDLVRVNLVICSSVMVKRDCLTSAIGFPEEVELKALEDYSLWLRIATQTDFGYIDTPLVNYRDDPKNSIRANGVGKAEERERVFRNAYEWSQGCAGVSPEAKRLLRKAYRRALRKNGKYIQSWRLFW